MTMGPLEVAVLVTGVENAKAAYRLMNLDPTFPRPFRPYGNPRGAKRWMRKSVEAWVRRKAREAQKRSA